MSPEPEDATAPSCVGCTWVRWKKTAYESLPVCVHPRAAVTVGDPVYGFTTRGWQYCAQAREAEVGVCGPEGRLWGAGHPRGLVAELQEWWTDPQRVRRAPLYDWRPGSFRSRSGITRP